MRLEFTLPAAVAAVAAVACAGASFATEVAVCTDQGRFVIDLADEKAPKHVENFLRYVDMGYYSGKVFHRARPGFVVQGGGLDRDLRPRPTLPPVPNESNNGLSNLRGTVAAARTADPDSHTSQFFVNLSDNVALDVAQEPGYTVFGRVTLGIQVLDGISRLPTGAKGALTADVPTPLPVIKSAARLDEAALAAIPEDGREAEIKRRIMEAAGAENFAEALQWIGHYRAICGADDPAISVTEAKAALATQDQRRAVLALEEYFVTTERDDPTYDDAIALYGNAVPENRQSAAQLADDCDAPEQPTIPDGTASTMEQMVAGQAQVKQFVSGGETYLACLAKIIDNEERTAADRNAAIGEHNRMVSAMEQTASDFNAQIRAFKTKQ
jgi:cyclophilin family peptidyl-prolyl cis-trans isomerase